MRNEDENNVTAGEKERVYDKAAVLLTVTKECTGEGSEKVKEGEDEQELEYKGEGEDEDDEEDDNFKADFNAFWEDLVSPEDGEDNAVDEQYEG